MRSAWMATGSIRNCETRVATISSSLAAFIWAGLSDSTAAWTCRRWLSSVACMSVPLNRRSSTTILLDPDVAGQQSLHEAAFLLGDGLSQERETRDLLKRRIEDVRDCRLLLPARQRQSQTGEVVV